jgi:ComF family protein
LNSLFNIFHDLFSLVFPQVCPACGNNLYIGENSICTKCLYELPKTNFHLNKDNEVARLFWGRVKLEAATSYYIYFKGSKFQNIIHQFKYKGQKHIGYNLGRIFGAELKNTSFSEIEIIHPVPLHFRKLKRRGYNQSEYIARGISESLNKPVITDAICRVKDVGTQTIKSRYERWENITDVFKVKKVNKLENKHILLVDDVVTTGSTLEACASEILKLDSTRVSIATLVYAKFG